MGWVHAARSSEINEIHFVQKKVRHRSTLHQGQFLELAL
jgi:hypothetical protein